MDRGYRSGGKLHCAALELSDKTDFRLETNSKLLFHGILRYRNQLTHVAGGRVAEVDHDVGVDMRNLCAAVAMTLESALIDQPASSHSLDLLEDRARTRVKLKPRVTGAAPAQVFLHDFVHGGSFPSFKLKSDGEGNIVAVVENARVVAEFHVVGAYSFSAAFFREEIARVKNIGDEHGPLALGLWLEEMKVLPDSAPNRAGDSHVVLESGPATLYRLGYDLPDDCATLDPQPAIIRKIEMAGMIPDHDSTKALVANEDIRAQSKNKQGNTQFAGGKNSFRQIVRGACRIKKIRRTANAERGVWSERLVAAEL